MWNEAFGLVHTNTMGPVRLLPLIAATAAISLAACGEDAGQGSTTDAPTRTTTPAATKAKPFCQKASRKLLAAIGAGLQVDGGAGHLKRGSVVKSGDFSKVYIVAAEIDGPGLKGDGDVGVWATNSTTADGLILAVDSAAKEFSDWGDADKTEAAIDQSADGVSEAEACATR